jgi:isopentenyl diphosphate isomerase/L-lactate dehydrogenase-like FMN-dependent dehydrogenase
MRTQQAGKALQARGVRADIGIESALGTSASQIVAHRARGTRTGKGRPCWFIVVLMIVNANVATQTFASWNPIREWLRRVEAFRQGA